MAREIGELFERSTFLNGSVWRIAPQQNEKKGKLHIKVWNGYGRVLINWTGHRIPKDVLDKIEELEDWTNLSSGLDYLWFTGKLA